MGFITDWWNKGWSEPQYDGLDFISDKEKGEPETHESDPTAHMELAVFMADLVDSFELTGFTRSEAFDMARTVMVSQITANNAKAPLHVGPVPGK